MLRQRVITAVVLLALLLPSVWASSPWPFMAMTLLLVAAAAWEWGRLNGAGSTLSYGMGLAVALSCAASIGLGWERLPAHGGWWLAAILWVGAGALALRLGPSGWARLPQSLRWVCGAILLAAAWLALASAKLVGLNFLLSVFALVWVADIAAYAGGRRFGRRKLAPTISPGKSWEGVISGVLGVFVLAIAWMQLDAHVAVDSKSLYTRLWQSFGWWGFTLGTASLAAMSVVGDLFESLVKRAAGQKDSSSLLPGHGGVLDRIDALLPVFPIALALASLSGA
jgi:phosphatidate cytidylyltransferase